MPVYAKPLTLHKGVDNQIQFQFLNQEQKPVDITGKLITCRIINNDGTAVLLEKALTIQLALTGIAALYVTPVELENIDAQKCYYSLEIPVSDFDYPVFVDQNAGARGDMNIVNSVLPSFVPSMPVSIPTGQAFPSNTSTSGDVALTYVSSVITTNENPVLTLQATYANYYGNTSVEGSSIVDGDWYPITFNEYSGLTETKGYVVEGFHPFIRMQFISNTGIVTNILAR